MIMAIDYATSMGVAWTIDSKTIYVSSIVGSHYEHLAFLNGIIGRKKVVVLVEQLNFFRNAKTVRSLLLKAGYVVYSITKRPEFVSAPASRKFLNCKNKKQVFDKFSDVVQNTDESDAIALLLYKLNKQRDEVSIERR